MAHTQGLTSEREARMIDAHKAGRAVAAEVFAVACNKAIERWQGDHEAQFSFIAGFAAELRRLGAQTQNKGFRL